MRAPLLAVVFALLMSPAAIAQPYIGSGTPRGGSLEISGSMVSTAGYDAGSRPALESTDSTTTGTPGFTLFTTSSRVARAIGGEARLGVYLSPRIAIEGAFQFSRPALRTRVADDFENAVPITAEETVSSYVAGGSLLYHFGSGRLVPFVAGGGGYVRQLHEDNTGVVTGSEVHGGGGIKYWFGTAASRLGLRFDAQVSARSNSIAFEEKRRVVPVFGAGLVYLF